MKTLRFYGILLPLFFLVTSLQADPIDDKLKDLERRILTQEGFQNNLRTEVDQHKTSLDQRFSQLSADNSKNLWVILGAVIVGAAGLVTSYLFGIQSAKKKMLEKAEKVVDEYITRELPEAAMKEVRKQLVDVVKTKIQPLMDAAGNQQAETYIRETSGIVVLSENEAKGAAVQRVLSQTGFKKVSIHPLTNPDNLPPADLYVFDRDPNTAPSEPTLLKDTKIHQVLNKYRDKHCFIYYGPKNESLGPAMHPRLSFSNTEATLPTRVLELLRSNIASTL